LRRWLVCPECRRRAVELYFRRAHAHCRRCVGLTYRSQCERPVVRARRRAKSIRVALGGSGDLQEPFPDRPWGMHRKTYEKLRRTAQGAEDLVRSHPERHWRLDRDRY
jgi:hypothetical protein